jgi:hypothetical protein
MRPLIQAPYRSRQEKPACISGEPEKTECELIAMKLAEEEKTNPNRRRVLERVILPETWKPQRHHWGVVFPTPGYAESSICLAKDRFRIRVEGWEGDRVRLAPGWKFSDLADCTGQIVIVTWSRRAPSHTPFGPAPRRSGHEHTYWIEYFGPKTGGVIRRSGPFGCTSDPVDHAMTDGGFSEPGVDGGYALLDSEDNVVKVET